MCRRAPTLSEQSFSSTTLTRWFAALLCSVQETLRLLKAFQFADSHGEVCPHGWQPGDATIVPEPDASKTFFKTAWDRKQEL